MFELPHAKRNAVFTALYNLLKTAKVPQPYNGWKLTGQRLVLWDEVDPANQPAMFLHRGPQQAEQRVAFGVTKWSLRATAWIYFRVDDFKTTLTDDTNYPGKVIDEFIDNFEQVMYNGDEGPLTLGGLVYHCYIDGTIVSEPGIADNQGVIMVPITILF